MGELDKVIDALMKASAEKIDSSTSAEEKEELINALKEKKKASIIREIREEYKSEVMREAELEIQKKNERRKIVELRSLMWNGFLIAFIVGLTVNQVTDLIGFYKGNVSLEEIWPTVGIIAFLLVLCLVFYFYGFLKSALSVLGMKEE